jgi:manganese/zinc/iron transport system ATP- binding protein
VGAQVALVGPNGAGKSTLLKAVAGLLPVREGTIAIYGNPVGACHHRVAYLPQRGEIDWRFPVSLRRLVLTGRYVHLGWFRRPGKADEAIAESMIAELGLSDLADRQIGQLSGGQQQRALLARALAQQADLLLLDEPLNAVDADTRAIISEVLKRLQAQGKTVVAATHDLGRLEADFDGAMYLAEGREVPAPPGAFTGIMIGGQPCSSG